jgi:VanZ family protein
MMWLKIEQLPRWLRDGAPLLAWMSVIFILSAQPALIDLQNDIDEKVLYKSAHILAYAILAWLWWRWLAPARRLNWSVLLTAFALATLYGVSDEFHQVFVPGRHSRLADVFFDAAGALAMILLIRRVSWLRTLPDSLRLPLARLSRGES